MIFLFREHGKVILFISSEMSLKSLSTTCQRVCVADYRTQNCPSVNQKISSSRHFHSPTKKMLALICVDIFRSFSINLFWIERLKANDLST